MTHTITLDRYSVDSLIAIATKRPRLELADDVRARITAGASCLANQVANRPIYGVTTGFGALAEHAVPPELSPELQRRHVVSHACGVGPFVDEAVARLALLIKLLTFRGGHSGISLRVVERLIELWNASTIPAIPLQGTVGASGDLAPLAHLALPLLGLGHVHANGRVVPAPSQAVGLVGKDGLALTNGVQFITAIAAHCVAECAHLARAADAISALSIQAFSGAAQFYAAAYHETSPHVERGVVAANLRQLLEGSNHHALPTAVTSKQDPYSFRCIPQVHGASRQAIRFVRQTVDDELNGVSDNPLVFPERDEVLCGGNLHGESIAMALDFLAIAAAELGSISERRTYQLLSGRRGLPDFLTHDAGLNSGLMVIQYTAAALVNHSKVLCTPASVDTIPTCQLQEDHVSMGGTSAIKMLQILDNVRRVLAIELITAAQALSMTPALVLSDATATLHAAFRQNVPALAADDRVIADDVAVATRFVGTELRGWTDRLG